MILKKLMFVGVIKFILIMPEYGEVSEWVRKVMKEEEWMEWMEG